MYIIKNAIRNITRTKFRNILIGIIIFIVATSSCVALSIKNSSSKLIQSYKNSNKIEGQITLNIEKMRGEIKQARQEESVTNKNFMDNIEKLDIQKIK